VERVLMVSLVVRGGAALGGRKNGILDVNAS
jgi:hypothetical protein